MGKAGCHIIGSPAQVSIEVCFDANDFVSIRYWVGHRAIGDIQTLNHRATVFRGLHTLRESLNGLVPKSEEIDLVTFFSTIVSRSQGLDYWVVAESPEYAARLTFECESLDGILPMSSAYQVGSLFMRWIWRASSRLLQTSFLVIYCESSRRR